MPGDPGSWQGQMRKTVGGSRFLIAALALLLAFGFLGSRGLWDPDEGRYSNVALTMLDSGDWINPRRNEDTGHWTKPPLTYWAIGASVAVFGPNPWAARLPSALAYLLCIALAWRCARRLVPGSEAVAALAYMTMLMPFIAGQLVTTDFILTAMQTLAVTAFVEWRFGPAANAGRYWWLMWIAYAAAFMTKGPPALLPMLVSVVFLWLAPPGRALRWSHVLAGLLLFLALALPWFVLVSLENEGLLNYFLGAEVIDRVATDRFGRHGEWYGWAEIYLPTLLVGTLPWTGSLWNWLRGLRAAVLRWRSALARQAEATDLFLALWIAIPLLVFCLARSRLPLYLLPLFVPLALVVARQRADRGLALPDWRWLAAWAVLLLGLRFAAAHYPTEKDASAWAREISARTQGQVTEVVFVEDMARYALHLHLGVEVEKLSIDPRQQPRFNPEDDETLRQELDESDTEEHVVYITKQTLWPTLAQRIAAAGYQAVPLGSPYRGRIIFETRPRLREPGAPWKK